MSKRRFRLPSPALVISMVTLSLVLGGTAVAASTAKSKHKDVKADKALIKKMAPSLSVKHAKTAGKARTATNATNAVNATHATTADSATHATTADSATHATTADSATHATTADSATNATNATNATHAANATNADNANNLGGLPPDAYVSSDTLQSGTFTLDPGTTGEVLFEDGPLSITADCTLSAGVTTLHVNVVSSVDNWIWFENLQATAGTQINDNLSDGFSPGSFASGRDRLEIVAPDGSALLGQDVYGVNYPNVGQCFVSAWVVAN